MSRAQCEILADIQSFQPKGVKWLGLDSLLEELWHYPASTEWVGPLLSVFERYPDEDGAGVFWSIVHGLETIPGYESILKSSQERTPCKFKAIMLKRIANADKPT